LNINVYKPDKEFDNLVSRLKAEKKRIVFTNGVFDIIHRGHIEYLNEAKKLGDVLVVGLNSDSSVRRIKGNTRPINNENDRAVVLVNLKPVDFVVIFEEDTPYNIISRIIPNVLLKGGDWKIKDIVGSDVVLNSGGKVLSIKYINNYSTTSIINKIIET
jgi:rfaE bifunctional protein nucleotidyltransferase chain/domain